MFDYIWIIPVFPLLGVFVNASLGRWWKGNAAGWLASSVIGLPFAASLILFYQFLSSPVESRMLEKTFFTWIAAGSFSAEIGMQIDALSMVMILIVTGVSFVIHIYAIGYMHNDPGFVRFFIYLNLFVFAMLILVMANNFLMMFIGWEGVGLCSYLLIGFWHQVDANADAGRKAFLVNRIGDFGFLLAIMLIFVTFGTVDFTSVFAQAASSFVPGDGVLLAIALLLFLGAVGKSAQIPLYIWLPDAMAGPTPVSALIHAATMVTAGVYMVARANVLYTLSPVALTVVAVIGAATAFFSALVGLTQFDIKRVLAYSTISQLGFMFLALGVGAYGAAIFHLMTHAFFKALLFLGAGSVMHAMSNQVDMRLMGGLRKKLPITYGTMLIGTLAIAGIPGFSGFFSKDEILWRAFSGVNGHPVFWLVGVAAAAMTTFYMFRLIFMTFHGASRIDPQIERQVHESPGIMTIPLLALALLSIIGGYVGIPALLGGANRFEHFLAPVFDSSENLWHSFGFVTAGRFNHDVEGMLMLLVFLFTLLSLWLAYLFYIKNTRLPEWVVTKCKRTYALVYHKFYIDELYHALIVRPLRKLSDVWLWKIMDIKIIDGLVNRLASMVGESGHALAALQTGSVQNYALLFVVGVAALLALLF